MRITKTSPCYSLSIILFLFMLSGCSDNTVGDDSSDDILPVENLSFSNHIQPIFNNRCAPCHISQTTNGVRLNNFNNIMNSEGDQYGMNIIIPTKPDESPLVDKIEPNPQFGARMPQGQSPLSDNQIEAIRAWIEEGAEAN